MLKGSQRSKRTVKNEHNPELLRLSALVEEMQREFSNQKQEMHQKIARLEEELVKTRQIAQANNALEERPTSRRRMLKRLGAAAAGLAVAGVAAGVGNEPQTAYAASALQIPSTGEGVATNTGGNTTILNTPPSGPQPFNTFNVQNLFGGGVNADALVANAASGVAVNAQTNSGNSAILGVQNTNSGINTAIAGNADAITTTAAITGSSDTAIGVAGFSLSRAGIFGLGAGGSGGTGGIFQVGSDGTKITGSAPLRLVPEPQQGPPTNAIGISHAKGELHVDANADLWLCTVTGTPGTVPMPPSEISRRYPGLPAEDQQRLLVGAPPSFIKVNGGVAGYTIVFLNSPVRVVGRNTTFSDGTVAYANFPPVAGNTVPSYFMIEGSWGTAANPQVIPSNAVGVIGFFTVVGTAGGGFATVYPADTSRPVVATINYPINATMTGSFTARLGVMPNTGTLYPQGVNTTGKKGLAVASFSACSIAIEIVAYLT